MAAAAEPQKMITGHFGLAAGAKSVDVRAPLWSLMLATVWLDVLFIPLLLLNIETIDTLPGGGYGNRVIHADYTHSLLGALVLCAAFGAAAWCAGIVASVCCSAASRSRTGYLISSCTAETCRSCPEMPAIYHCLVSGSGGCQSWRYRWRRHCSCSESFFTGAPQSQWELGPAAESHQR